MTDPVVGDQRNVVIETFVLGVERSTLRGVVGSDLLRSAIDMNYESVVVDNRIDLDVIWKTIEALPGFEPKNAEAPFCWFKSLEPRLNMKVVMPKALENITSAAFATAAALCLVKPKEVEIVLLGRRAPAPGELSGPIVDPTLPASFPAEMPRRPTPGPSTMRRKRPEIPQAGWRQRKAVGIAAGVVSLLAAAWIALTFVQSCEPPAKWQAISTADLGIPVNNVKQLGGQVGATLSDPRWLNRPEADRRQQMENALRRLKSRNVTVFFVSDESRPRASAQWSGGTVVVRFY